MAGRKPADCPGRLEPLVGQALYLLCPSLFIRMRCQSSFHTGGPKLPTVAPGVVGAAERAVPIFVAEIKNRAV